MTLSFRSFLLAAAVTACSVIGAAWLYTRYMPMRFLESGYPIWVAKQAILRRCDFGAILVLGDSRAEAAIVPAELPFPAANITFGGTTPDETYYFASEALKCPNPPRLVVYSHSMPAFLHPTPGLWKTATRYGYISFRQLRDIAAVADQDHDPWLATMNTNDGLTGVVRDMIYGVGFPSVFMASLIEARGIGRYEYNKVLLERTAATRGQVIYPEPPDKQLVGIDAEVTAFTPSPLEAGYFDRTLGLLSAARVPVLLLTIPAGNSTVAAVPSRVKTAFSRFLIEHSEPYQTVTPAPAELLGWPDDFYVDGSHMNPRGAKVFTARLASCLRRLDERDDRPEPCDLVWK